MKSQLVFGISEGLLSLTDFTYVDSFWFSLLQLNFKLRWVLFRERVADIGVNAAALDFFQSLLIPTLYEEIKDSCESFLDSYFFPWHYCQLPLTDIP